jgi:hypothetical protein
MLSLQHGQCGSSLSGPPRQLADRADLSRLGNGRSTIAEHGFSERLGGSSRSPRRSTDPMTPCSRTRSSSRLAGSGPYRHSSEFDGLWAQVHARLHACDIASGRLRDQAGAEALRPDHRRIVSSASHRASVTRSLRSSALTGSLPACRLARTMTSRRRPRTQGHRDRGLERIHRESSVATAAGSDCSA